MRRKLEGNSRTTMNVARLLIWAPGRLLGVLNVAPPLALFDEPGELVRLSFLQRSALSPDSRCAVRVLGVPRSTSEGIRRHTHSEGSRIVYGYRAAKGIVTDHNQTSRELNVL